MVERERKRSMTAYDLIKRYPKVFVTTPDENGNEVFGINANASLKDLFEAYSDIVHYVDNRLISMLEELIRKKIGQMDYEKEKR